MNMKISQLRKQAIAVGVETESVDEAQDSDDPRESLMALIISAKSAELRGAKAGAQTADMAAVEALWSELAGMKMSQLRKQAKAANVENEKVEEAMDSDDPRESMVALIISVKSAELRGSEAGTQIADMAVEALRSELAGMKMSQLVKQAKAANVENEKVEEAMDSDDPREGLVAFIISAKGHSVKRASPRRPRRPRRASPRRKSAMIAGLADSQKIIALQHSLKAKLKSMYSNMTQQPGMATQFHLHHLRSQHSLMISQRILLLFYLLAVCYTAVLGYIKRVHAVHMLDDGAEQSVTCCSTTSEDDETLEGILLSSNGFTVVSVPLMLLNGYGDAFNYEFAPYLQLEKDLSFVCTKLGMTGDEYKAYIDWPHELVTKIAKTQQVQGLLCMLATFIVNFCAEDMLSVVLNLMGIHFLTSIDEWTNNNKRGSLNILRLHQDVHRYPHLDGESHRSGNSCENTLEQKILNALRGYSKLWGIDAATLLSEDSVSNGFADVDGRIEAMVDGNAPHEMLGKP
jgi:hypothetical protein